MSIANVYRLSPKEREEALIKGELKPKQEKKKGATATVDGKDLKYSEESEKWREKKK